MARLNISHQPKSLDTFIGQNHLLNEIDGQIYGFVRLGYLPSMILHGPPGTGKTTLAHLLAKHFDYKFIELSATDTTLSELKDIQADLQKRNRKRRYSLKVVIFIDEFHRFSTKQQDFLLSYIESGLMIFIGATSSNIRTRIRSAIKSRCQIFELVLLNNHDMTRIIRNNLDTENSLRMENNLPKLVYTEESIEMIVAHANGDIRSAGNLLSLSSVALQNNLEMNAKKMEMVMASIQPRNPNSNDLERYQTLFDLLRGKLPKMERKNRGDMKAVDSETPIFDDIQDESLFREHLSGKMYNDGDSYDYESRMIVSDDSDTDSLVDGQVPVSYNKIRPTQFFKLQAMLQVSRLLETGESPLSIGKRLLLFISVTSSCHTLLTKVSKYIKGLKTLENQLALLETCIECILRAPKLELNPSNDLLLHLNQAKLFLQPPQMPSVEPAVSYESELIESLSQPPVNETVVSASKFVVSLYSDCVDDYTIGCVD